MAQDVPVTLNRLILDYDQIVVCGPVFPHEVVGFSGGNKYFFPGISGPEVINFTHWLGAVITSYEIIGTKNTPVRAVIDRAASLDPACPSSCFSLVVKRPRRPGAGCTSARRRRPRTPAADLSAQVHIVCVEKPYQRVLSVMPEMYDDIWTAAKGMYKMEPAIADGGEVIIYAPHITEISYTHGTLHRPDRLPLRDYFLKQWDRVQGRSVGRAGPLDAPARAWAPTTETGVETPRIQVTLATGIPRERCERVNLGYLDPATIDPAGVEGPGRRRHPAGAEGRGDAVQSRKEPEIREAR